MKQHAKLSPSSSDRWLHCAGSLNVNPPSDRSNIYADEGTAAHSLLEMCHRIGNDPHKYLGVAMHKGHVVTEEMADAVGHALDYVRGYMKTHPGTKLHIEHEVDPAAMVRCQTGLASGTPDMVLDNPRDLELEVIDYKHGAGVPVEVHGNTQVLQYLVAYTSQRLTRPYKKYRGIIIQPRSRHEDGPVRTVEYTHDDILAHAKKLRQRIIHIERHPDERVAGDWCRWCAGAGQCRTLAQRSLEAAQLEFGKEGQVPVDPHELSVKEVAELMAMTDMIEEWLHAVRGIVLLHLQRGRKVPGWKLVYGRTQRQWRDARAVAKALLAMGFKPDQIAPRSLLGVPGVEALLKEAGKMQGKGKARTMPKPIARLVQRTVPAMHVAPIDDPRPPVQRGQEFKER